MMADLGIADCSRLTEHTGHHGCECGANTPLVQPPMNDTVAVREDAENRRDPDVVAICDELDALRITEVKLRDALARAAAAIKRRDDVGLLNRPTLIDEDGVDHIIDALVEVGAPVDDRERVPEGWRVEWLVEEPEGPGCGPRRIPYLDQIPAVSPSVDPEEEP